MPQQRPAGPYRTLTSVSGAEFPYYIIPFDKDGTCEGPLTRAHLLEHVGDVTDLFLFSHGWNNDWTAATERYEDFIKGYQQLVTNQGLPLPTPYRPLLVGIFWPSQTMAWFSGEKGPDFAGADPAVQDAIATDEHAMLTDLAAALDPGEREAFYRLMEQRALDAAGARQLATMLASIAGGDDEAGREASPSADDLLASAVALTAEEPDYGAIGDVGTGAPAAGPQAAGLGGLLAKLDPRNIVKPFTVWQMKDRAGKVGTFGVGPLLRELLAATGDQARVHLVGHSYGCKVVMSAASVRGDFVRPIESALLLQPAVSQYAFAASVPHRNGVAGGFHRALARVRRPILATFSKHDSALRKMFHVAVRRHDDVGELQFAGGVHDSPNRFGALGGYGPQDSGDHYVDIKDPVDPYDLSGGATVIGVHGSRTIKGHGEISVPSTWWMLYSLATAHLRV